VRRAFFLLMLLLAALAVLLGFWGQGGPGSGGNCLCVYYGPVDDSVLHWLSTCRTAVLAPTLPHHVLRVLHGAGVEVYGYVSLTTLGGWEPWARMVNDSMLVEPAGGPWGEAVVNPCSRGWRSVLHWAIEYLQQRGYDGVFLDNLDMVDHYLWMRGCVEELVRQVKAWSPGLRVVVNRGFTVLPHIADVIDGLLFEDFVTYYSPGKGYGVFSASELMWEKKVLNQTLELSERWGFQVFLLAYAPPGDTELLDRICREWRSWGHGLPLYVAPGTLQEPGVCNPCRS